MAETRKLTLKCPECASELIVDSETGQILIHKKAKEALAGGKDFDSLLEGLKTERSKADEIFERERAALKDHDRLMEERFQEAMKRAEEDPDKGRPVRPFDLD